MKRRATVDEFQLNDSLIQTRRGTLHLKFLRHCLDGRGKGAVVQPTFDVTPAPFLIVCQGQTPVRENGLIYDQVMNFRLLLLGIDRITVSLLPTRSLRTKGRNERIGPSLGPGLTSLVRGYCALELQESLFTFVRSRSVS